MTTISLDRLAAHPQLILSARRKQPSTSRRLYHRQLEFLANVYGVTSDFIEAQFDVQPERVY